MLLIYLTIQFTTIELDIDSNRNAFDCWSDRVENDNTKKKKETERRHQIQCIHNAETNLNAATTKKKRMVQHENYREHAWIDSDEWIGFVEAANGHDTCVTHQTIPHVFSWCCCYVCACQMWEKRFLTSHSNKHIHTQCVTVTHSLKYPVPCEMAFTKQTICDVCAMIWIRSAFINKNVYRIARWNRLIWIT